MLDLRAAAGAWAREAQPPPEELLERVRPGAALMGLRALTRLLLDRRLEVDSVLLEGIEILRGPSALLYGGGAIGGAVNLIDKKVPTVVPANGGEGVAEVRLGSADNEEAAVAGLTAGGNGFAVRVGHGTFVHIADARRCHSGPQTAQSRDKIRQKGE
jgi:outer membrane receptor protein involved in Fe transport